MYTHILASAMTRLGVTPHILAERVAGTISDSQVSDLERTFELRPWWGHLLSPILYRISPGLYARHRLRWSLLAEISRLVRECGIDLVEMEESFGVADQVTSRCRIPVVLRLHGPWFLNGTALGAPHDEAFERRVQAEGRALRSAAMVCAPSRDVLERTITYYNFRPQRAEVIPLPVTQVPDDLRWQAGGREEGRVLFVGRFDRHKGGDLVIDAFRRLRQLRPAVRLIFVGPDRGIVTTSGQKLGIREYIEATIRELETRGAIEWLGPLTPIEVSTQRRRASVVVMASRYENSPYACLEAMAAGCPLVVPDVGGFPEMVEHERSGLLFRGGDSEELATAILRLIEQPDLAASLGQQARADCRERYEPDRVAMRTLDLYRSVLDSRKVRDTVYTHP